MPSRKFAAASLAALTLLLAVARGPVDAAETPGSLIRGEAMPGAPDGARAYRVLYWSTGLAGEPIRISGVSRQSRDVPFSG
jgi:hypothetical protein